jgi:hypothetical protein
LPHFHINICPQDILFKHEHIHISDCDISLSCGILTTVT